MNILVIDTATEACSVALEFEGKVFCRFEVCPQQHSQRILPMIDEVLQEAKASLHDLDCLGFGRGPGSFTGVRIATGILQGLALGAELKVVGVSTLAAMAQQAFALQQTQQVCAAIDARMSEVYFGQYQLQNNIMTLVAEEQVLAPEEVATLMANASASLKAGRQFDRLSIQNKTKGGSRETEEKEFAVRPWGMPDWSRVVTTVTPVAKFPKTLRNSLELNAITQYSIPNKSVFFALMDATAPYK